MSNILGYSPVLVANPPSPRQVTYANDIRRVLEKNGIETIFPTDYTASAYWRYINDNKKEFDRLRPRPTYHRRSYIPGRWSLGEYLESDADWKLAMDFDW